jgi:hypothetical protein
MAETSQPYLKWKVEAAKMGALFPIRKVSWMR